MPKTKRQVNCDYCEKPARLMDSAPLYGGISYGMVWACFDCNAWVGCHKNSKDHAPLGRLANKELRRAKMEAHRALDPLWKSGGMRRKDAYQLVAEQMSIPAREMHIGMLDVNQCRRVVEVCLELRK